MGCAAFSKKTFGLRYVALNSEHTVDTLWAVCVSRRRPPHAFGPTSPRSSESILVGQIQDFQIRSQKFYCIIAFETALRQSQICETKNEQKRIVTKRLTPKQTRQKTKKKRKEKLLTSPESPLCVRVCVCVCVCRLFTQKKKKIYNG